MRASLAVMPPAEFAGRPVAGGLPMVGALAVAAAGTLGFLADVAAAPLLSILGVAPSAAIVAAAWTAAGRGPLVGALAGTGLGLALDLAFGRALVSPGAWAAALLAAGAIGRRLGTENPFARPLAVAAASVVLGLLAFLFAAVAGLPPAPLRAVAARTVLDAVLAGLAGGAIALSTSARPAARP